MYEWLPQRRRLSLLAFAAVAPLALSCKATTGSHATVKDLAADRSATNVALLFGARDCGGECTESDLPGVQTDLDKLGPVLQDQFGFKVMPIKIDGQQYNKDMVIALSGEAAKLVGDSGTLLWYYTGHGSKTGALHVDRAGMMFQEVADAIKEARGNQPLRRLIVIADSCFSGRLATGSDSIVGMAPPTAADIKAGLKTTEQAFSQSVLTSLGAGGLNLSGSELYQQLIVLSASSPTKTASDDGNEAGSRYTHAFRESVTDYRSQGLNPGITQFVKDVQTRVNRLEPSGQQPISAVVPATVGREKLFEAAQGSGGSIAINVPPARRHGSQPSSASRQPASTGDSGQQAASGDGTTLTMSGRGTVRLNFPSRPVGSAVSISFAAGCDGPWKSARLVVNGAQYTCDNCTDPQQVASGPWVYGLGSPMAVRSVAADIGDGSCDYQVTVTP